MVAEAASGSLCAWLWLALGHGRFWRLGGLVPQPAERTSDRVVAVIPARDEAETIAETVASLGNVPVIVVDDNSSDGTGELAARAGATVIRAGPLAPGWTGKMWA